MMPMTGDILAFEIGGEGFAIDTVSVSSIVQVERLAAIPGQSGFVCGIVSLRGEPVTVVDAREVFGLDDDGNAAGRAARGGLRVVVAGDETRSIGINLRDTKPYFMWKEGLDGAVFTEEHGRFTCGWLQIGEVRYYMIDWETLFEETARILATEQNDG